MVEATAPVVPQLSSVIPPIPVGANRAHAGEKCEGQRAAEPAPGSPFSMGNGAIDPICRASAARYTLRRFPDGALECLVWFGLARRQAAHFVDPHGNAAAQLANSLNRPGAVQ